MKIEFSRNTTPHAVAWWPGHGIKKGPHIQKWAMVSIPYIVKIQIYWQ